jgi:hypothetical protein
MGDSSDSETDDDDNNYALRNTKTNTRRRRSILKNSKQSDLEEGIENDMTMTLNNFNKSNLEEEETEVSTLKDEEGSKKIP